MICWRQQLPSSIAPAFQLRAEADLYLALLCKRKFLQCEATRTVESSITGVATNYNNYYAMNFNYLATRGGNWPPIPPLDPALSVVVNSTRLKALRSAG